MKKLFTMLAVLMVSTQAWAIDLASAKAQGLIGERNDGYLGYVIKPASAEVKVLVQTVNNLRKASYQKIAGSNGLSLSQVSVLVAKKTSSKTTTGNFYQNAAGKWIKK